MLNNGIRLYFAYGSNLNLEQMGQKCSITPQALCIARLPGYKISFRGYSSFWDGALETVIPDDHSQVWGVLYQMTADQWRELDSQQDVRDDGTGTYFHYPVEVSTEQQCLVAASIYKKAVEGQVECPSTEYLKTIVQGATKQKLPAAYIAALLQFESKPASYPVPRRPIRKKTAEFSECSGCSC